MQKRRQEGLTFRTSRLLGILNSFELAALLEIERNTFISLIELKEKNLVLEIEKSWEFLLGVILELFKGLITYKNIRTTKFSTDHTKLLVMLMTLILSAVFTHNQKPEMSMMGDFKFEADQKFTYFCS